MLVTPDALPLVAAALAIDALLGDPDLLWRRWPHPVAWIGRLIAWGDRVLNKPRWSGFRRKLAGICAMAVLVGLSLVAGLVLDRLLRGLPFGLAALALVASVLLAQRSLYDHVGRVERALRIDDGLVAARGAVSMIVGRDPASLDAAGIARAAIETTAENFSDGVVAPAFWLALLGLPGLIAYKAVNTADSMIGHLSERHRDFGWAAARLDDIVNLVPARLSGCLVALVAPVAGGSIATASRMMWRDAGLHRSPNAGWPEAAMAGALGLALAGPRVYASGPVDDPFLNAGGREVATAGDIARALRVFVAAALLHAGLYVSLVAIK